jgi:hypothetical protein
LLGVDTDGWLKAARRQTEFFDRFGNRLPPALREEQAALIERLESRTHASAPSLDLVPA